MKSLYYLCIAASLLCLPLSSAAQVRLPETYRYSADGDRLIQGGLPATGLYDVTQLRTIELHFAQEDWWEQLTANYESEENILADLTMEGETYPDVGVRFKGMTSYMFSRNSQKKSFNIEIDYQDPDQRLMGYKTLNLNNAYGDATFMREVLFYDAVRRYTPGSKVCFVKLVINGENWGVYTHVQQLNSDLIEEWFVSDDGDRYKAPMQIGGDRNQPTGGTGFQPPADSTRFQPPTGFAPPQTFAEWQASDQARDLDGDGQITEEDFQLLNDRTVGFGPRQPGAGFQLPSLEEWQAGDQAADLDGDGQIDEADYQLFLQRQPGGGGFGGGIFGGGDAALTWLGEDSTAYAGVYEVKTDNNEDPWSPLIAACDVLNNTPLEGLARTADGVLAVDRWLWFLAVENIYTDEDSYLTKGADYQLYHEIETDRIHPLEHDGNETFDTRNANRDPFEGETNADRPVISRLLSVPSLRQRYLAHYRTILAESFDWDVIGPSVDQYRALIETEVEADTKRETTYEEFGSGLTALQRFVDQRRESLLANAEVGAQPPAILSVSVDVPAAGKSVLGTPPTLSPDRSARVTAQVDATVPPDQLLLYYATGLVEPFSSIPMFDDGEHGDGAAGDLLFAGEIPSLPAGNLVRYYVEARAADGTAAFSPAGAEHDVFVYQTAARPLAADPPVVINELMADNDGIVEDPQGDFDDWIELRNVSDREVDLSGMYLTDRGDEPTKWAFPEGTVLAPGAYLVVWADEDGGDEPGLHANFKLDSSGEEVYLVDADSRDNAILDLVAFAEQPTDQSYGRLPDGSGPFQEIPSPTPSSANQVRTAVLTGTGAQPLLFSLAQNYPNPFNGGTIIRFTLGETITPVDVSLEIFNLAGQKVAVLAEGEFTPGTYAAHWDGRSQRGEEMASGLYLYRLRAGTRVQTRRLLLLR